MNSEFIEIPTQNIVAFTQALVRVPSQASKNDPGEILSVIDSWADSHGLIFNKLLDLNDKRLGGFFHYASGEPGPVICLNACVDTCEFGDEATWRYSPTSGIVEGDYLYGRGAADSKIAIAIFCHLFHEITKAGLKCGELYVLLDGDEHTGNFGGVKTFLKNVPAKIDVVFIGYPGNEEIMIGARGFLRAKIVVHGRAAHTGSRCADGSNAVKKAAQLVEMIETASRRLKGDSSFPVPPKITVTEFYGGVGFSQVPDKATISIDMRLTPHFDSFVAGNWIKEILSGFDNNNQGSGDRDSDISFLESWPAYKISEHFPAVRALKEEAERELGRTVPLAVCGPSNIGNYLAEHNIAALCGFGVDFENIHAANESITISSIAPIYKAYRAAIERLASSRLVSQG